MMAYASMLLNDPLLLLLAHGQDLLALLDLLDEVEVGLGFLGP